MHKIFFAIILILNSYTSYSNEKPNSLGKYLKNAKLIGKGTYTFFFLDIYDVLLYSEKSIYEPNKNFALKLHYHRSFSGKDIAERSIQEIKDQGFKNTTKLNLWQKQMESIFPNVKKGQIITGIYIPNKETIFLSKNKELGRIMDSHFGRYFFNIWLGPNTKDPKLRNKLIGKNE